MPNGNNTPSIGNSTGRIIEDFRKSLTDDWSTDNGWLMRISWEFTGGEATPLEPRGHGSRTQHCHNYSRGQYQVDNTGGVKYSARRALRERRGIKPNATTPKISIIPRTAKLDTLAPEGLVSCQSALMVPRFWSQTRNSSGNREYEPEREGQKGSGILNDNERWKEPKRRERSAHIPDGADHDSTVEASLGLQGLLHLDPCAK
ncbi:predicted protein [Histoplasma capsulatum G186AR]|uniref:Uncharacterized protein n=1 Tax=Ajellomyces capsulatus (strain G186AR / H82 / ATCC MYA-2454 / RMSCC 2432) TaxID=447093 RepID=C0NYF2_AJECG|nr:uncharacterized protein HCBG_07946 [Histoplasma capsulatum G186AR]EEH03820.1 predicted protein [Histoplasma capsulatum G186AR]